MKAEPTRLSTWKLTSSLEVLVIVVDIQKADTNSPHLKLQPELGWQNKRQNMLLSKTATNANVFFVNKTSAVDFALLTVKIKDFPLRSHNILTYFELVHMFIWRRICWSNTYLLHQQRKWMEKLPTRRCSSVPFRILRELRTEINQAFKFSQWAGTLPTFGFAPEVATDPECRSWLHHRLRQDSAFFRTRSRSQNFVKNLTRIWSHFLSFAGAGVCIVFTNVIA